MSSKRDSGDWSSLRKLPSVREKLSGIRLLGRGLSRKKTMSTLGENPDERPSMDGSTKSGFPRVQVQDFGTSTLDIDLHALEAFRSVQQPQPQPQPSSSSRATRPDKAAQKQKPPPAAPPSTTPIADMFSRRCSILEPTTANASPRTKPSQARPSPLANSSSSSSPSSSSADKPSPATSSTAKPSTVKPSPAKPLSPLTASSVNRAGRTAAAAAANGRRHGRASSNASGPVVSVTIISSDHSEPQPAKPWPPPETPRASAPIRTRVLTTSTSDARQQPGRLQLRDPPRAAYAPSSAGPNAAAEPVARYRHHVTAAVAEADKRHSTPSTTPMPPAGGGSSNYINGYSNNNNRTDRRRSWQPAQQQQQQQQASGPSTPSGPPSASAPWRNAVDRQTSARLATDRLSWIRALEQGKNTSSTISSDLPVLKTVRGSVADKLAKFESKRLQQQQQQMPPPPPLTRSNSTRSRPPSIADTYSSYGGVTTTTRSSLDSHRPSSVFSHYDDSFREKMEFIAGGPNRKDGDDGEEKPAALARVTSAFVSVERADRAEEKKPVLTPVTPVSVPAEKAEGEKAESSEDKVESNEETVESTEETVESTEDKVENNEEKPAVISVEKTEKDTEEKLSPTPVTSAFVPVDKTEEAVEKTEQKTALAPVDKAEEAVESTEAAFVPVEKSYKPACVDKPQAV
ncbi:hypothetical protein LX36DRAFT_475251 [Colletotrichum falcatum]|nr:hypothetical protein LX36DRAFT_475251 [Colletotrichum falcatum]